MNHLFVIKVSNAPFTEEEIAVLFQANGGKDRWTPLDSEKVAVYYTRKDGAILMLSKNSIGMFAGG